jgi:signal transduction histidine kinase
MTCRSLCLVMFLALWCTPMLWADGTYPIGYSAQQRFERSLAIPLDADLHRVLLVRQRPVWDPQAWVVSLNVKGTTVASTALDGDDVCAAQHVGSQVVLLTAHQGNIEALLLDDSLRCVARQRVDVPHRNTTAVAQSIGVLRQGRIAFVVNGSLVVCDVASATLSARVLDHDVLAAAVMSTPPFSIGYVRQQGSGAFVVVLDTALITRATTPVPASGMVRMESVGPYLAVCSPVGDNLSTQITVVDPRTNRTEFATVDVPPSLLTVFVRDSVLSVAAVRSLTNRYELVVQPLSAIGALDLEARGTPIPNDLHAPIRLQRSGSTLYVIFARGIMSARTDGKMMSSDVLPIGIAGTRLSVLPVSDGVLIRSMQGSVFLRRVEHQAWFVTRFVTTTREYLVPIVLSLIILVLLVLIRRHRRVLRAAMELPGSGLVFQVDSSGRLVRVNEKAAQLLRITSNVPMRRIVRSYMLTDSLRSLLEFISSAEMARSSMSERITLEDADVHRDYVFSAIPLRGSFGRYGGMVITGIDITEALERRRLVNWAQLAHDMQTNLSTIKLNAEQLDESNDVNRERRRRILFQVGVLIQRVRDLVSVGRSEEINRNLVHSAELCTEIRHEFDPAMFPHVTFSMKLRGTMMNVDRLKISRAVRNSVENAIKSLRGQRGTVEIATWFDRTNVYIRVSDTGVGMDPDTLKNMMKPYFTTARDGSGTGIGTMIMQHVMHLHGGTLRVSSEPGVGTQVIFRIPHGMDGTRLRNAQFAVTAESESAL